MRLSDIPVPATQSLSDIAVDGYTEIKPDVTTEIRVDETVFDLLIELDLTRRPAYNADKLKHYDDFLTGWCLTIRRIQQLQTRPLAIFVCRDATAMTNLAAKADEVMNGRIGVMGTPAHQWYFPGRDHILFAIETDLHYGSPRAFALPALPPWLRQKLTGSRELGLHEVALLPQRLMAAWAGSSK